MVHFSSATLENAHKDLALPAGDILLSTVTMAVPSADHLVGIIRTDLDNLDFLPLSSNEPSRLEKSQDVLRLLRIFTEAGWEPSSPANQLIGLVTTESLKPILSLLNMSCDDSLQTVVANEFPMATGSFRVLCSEGRRRVEAARAFLGKGAWWTVRLYCVASGGLLLHHKSS